MADKVLMFNPLQWKEHASKLKSDLPLDVRTEVAWVCGVYNSEKAYSKLKQKIEKRAGKIGSGAVCFQESYVSDCKCIFFSMARVYARYYETN